MAKIAKKRRSFQIKRRNKRAAKLRKLKQKHSKGHHILMITGKSIYPKMMRPVENWMSYLVMEISKYSQLGILFKDCYVVLNSGS